jgi:hypothetical protein
MFQKKDWILSTDRCLRPIMNTCVQRAASFAGSSLLLLMASVPFQQVAMAEVQVLAEGRC